MTTVLRQVELFGRPALDRAGNTENKNVTCVSAALRPSTFDWGTHYWEAATLKEAGHAKNPVIPRIKQRPSHSGPHPDKNEKKATEERREETIYKPGGFANDPDDPTNPNETIERHRRELAVKAPSWRLRGNRPVNPRGFT